MKIKKGFISQRAKSKLVIFDTEESTLYSFNSTARFIFERLKKNITIDQIADELTEKFRVDSDQARQDINRFVTQLKSKGIISG